MISIKAQNGEEPHAHIFIEDGERAVCLVLYRNTEPIACFRCDECGLEDAQVNLFDWIEGWDLTEHSLGELVIAFIEVYLDLDYFRRNGCLPDLSFLGSRSARRIPGVLLVQ